MLAGLFHEDTFQTIAEEMDRRWRFRVAVAVAWAIVLFGVVPRSEAVAWSVLIAGTEIWIRIRSRKVPVDGSIPFHRVAALSVLTSVWALGAAFCWLTGDGALRLAAIALLAGLLLMAGMRASRSRVATLAFGIGPAVAIVVLPVFFGGYAGWRLAALMLAIGLMGFYWLGDLASNFRIARDMQNIREDLARQTRTAIAATEAKSVAVAVVSHELRNPMNGVMGVAWALKRSGLDPAREAQLDMILKSGEGMLHILNDLLDVAKIEAGKVVLESISFNLLSVVEEVVGLLQDTAAAKGVDLGGELESTCPLWVVGDPVRVRQIMLNLTSNAVKFTTDGEVRLRVAASGLGVEISVSDTGPGLTEDQRVKLFSPYVQADASTTRKYGGTGLGLAIVKQLSELMGGSVGIDSTLGRGSVFRVRLKLPAGEPAQSEILESDDVDLAQLQILVIDDNETNRFVARAILEAAGAAVSTADDGEAALAWLEGHAADLVLSDIHMPKLDGIAFLHALRASGLPMADLPVIALTADVSEDDVRALDAEGFAAVQPKPLRPDRLLACISDIVRVDRQAPGGRRVSIKGRRNGR